MLLGLLCLVPPYWQARHELICNTYEHKDFFALEGNRMDDMDINMHVC